MIRIVWITGGALAGLAGVLLGIAQQVNFQMGFQILLLIFAGGHPRRARHRLRRPGRALVVGLFVEVSTLVIPTELKNVGALAISSSSCSSGPRASWAARERVG